MNYHELTDEIRSNIKTTEDKNKEIKIPLDILDYIIKQWIKKKLRG